MMKITVTLPDVVLVAGTGYYASLGKALASLLLTNEEEVIHVRFYREKEPPGLVWAGMFNARLL